MSEPVAQWKKVVFGLVMLLGMIVVAVYFKPFFDQ